MVFAYSTTLIVGGRIMNKNQKISAGIAATVTGIVLYKIGKQSEQKRREAGAYEALERIKYNIAQFYYDMAFNDIVNNY
jgi:hypothetical protein